MKKSGYQRIIFFITFLFVNALLVQSQKIYYVKPDNDGTNGSGTSAADAMYLSAFKTDLESLVQGTNSSVQVYFNPGNYLLTSRLSFSVADNARGYKVVFDKTPGMTGEVIFSGGGNASVNGNNQFVRLPRAGVSGFRSVLTIRNIILRDFYDVRNNNQLFEYYGGETYQTLNIENVIIDNCANAGVAEAGRMIYVGADYRILNIRNSTIKNCVYYRLIDKRFNDQMEISGNSFTGNTIRYQMIWIENGPAAGTGNLIYNNTFSGNTFTTSADANRLCINLTTTNRTQIFNNTFYNSGHVYISNASNNKKIINNIIAGTSKLRAASNAVANATCIRNISVSENGSNVFFYETGNSTGVEITTQFNNQFNPVLSGSSPGKEIHTLNDINNAVHVILEKGGSKAELLTDAGVMVNTDQRGEVRSDYYPISLGAVDYRRHYVLSNQTITIPFNSASGTLPQSREIDYRQLIVELPSGTGVDQTVFELIDTQNENGMLSGLSSDYKTTFTPRIEGGKPIGANVPYPYAYRVRSANSQFQASGVVRIMVYDEGRAPGIIDPSDYSNTCYDYMGAVAFRPAYKFITGSYSTNNASEINGYVVTSNDRSDRLYGFSIPLVGDLNGDGYPEIVALGINDNNVEDLANTAQYIYIYNGQTGERLVKFRFPNGYYWDNDYWHGSPSNLALIDADKNGRGEVIIAFGANGESSTSSYSKTVASFEVTLDGEKNITGLTQKWWNNTMPYDYPLTGSTAAGDSYKKPLPQVVDIEGDGIPEVVVYNKIYNAVTGEHLLTLDVLGSTAFVGRDPNGNTDRDRPVGFSYIYDIDWDGKYDIIAGGKIYYDIDLTPGAQTPYKTLTVRNADNSSNVPDGRTGVADINGDGIPEVVSVTRNSPNSSFTIYVWNPDFLYIDTGDNNKVKRRPTGYTPQPQVIAQRSVTIGSGTGSNSYVYIGDIDGRVQEVVDGGSIRQYRLPEIAVLAGSMTFNAATKSGAHPNVKDIATGGTTYGLPTSGASNALVAYTWDATPNVGVTERLKLSFILGHTDGSANTGFTMFDFDNDGIQEICYRDMYNLRIIKARIPYIASTYTETHASGAILFRKSVLSYTGFEYPVIADIDNDASAEMIVMGNNQIATKVYGFVYAVGTGGDKFAPALPVWNQFMYSPFKINADLTTPTGKALNPLDPQYTYKRIIRNESGMETIIPEYKPYNGTLTQVPYYDAISDGSGNANFEPIVFLVDAYIDEAHTYMEGSSIKIRIGNHGTARTDVSENTPVRVYRNSISPDNLDRTRDQGLHTIRTLGHTSAIQSGQYVDLTIPVSSSTGVYYVRLGDNSDNSTGSWVWRYGKNAESDPAPEGQSVGIGMSSRAYRDCNWSDNMVIASSFALIDDYATVQEYQSIGIRILENDKYPSDFFTNNFSLCDSVIMQPKAGTITCSGSGQGSQLIYTHTGQVELSEGIDSIRYKMSYYDTYATPAQWIRLEATVYIYVLQSNTGGFAACYGSNHTVSLKQIPSGISFYWYKPDGQTPSGTPNPRPSTTIADMRADSTYYIEPTITSGKFTGIIFPKGRLDIPVVNSGTSNAIMRWTGLADRNWMNPVNWVEINNGREIAVTYPPTSCVDVIIPTGLDNYPELTSSAVCNKISMEDRAMIAGINYLTYDNAEVEFALKPMERDRFVMWSPPLKDMYTGDYHFTLDGSTDYYWGDVFMNFFQMANPDVGGAAVENYFTATFGNIWTKLLPGQAFNLKVVNTSANRSRMFTFPKNNTQYQDANGQSGPNNTTVNLDRPSKARFMSDAVIDAGNSIPVRGDIAGSNYIQVVNPFMAYLKIRNFLTANQSVIEEAYKIWNGTVNASDPLNLTGDVVTIKPDKTDGSRYIIDNLDLISDQAALSAGLIPPLQSFFVKKRNTGTVGTLLMDPAWTTTVDSNTNGDYILRAELAETNTLRIKAIQGNVSSATVLFYHPESSPNYRNDEDAYKLFYSDAPVSVYSFSPANDPLAVNSSNDFSQQVRLGIRLQNPGQVTLNFTGLSTFGHDVYLIDHEQNNRETDLQRNPDYTFTVNRQPGANRVIELNNRFSLRMTYTGIGVGNEDVPESGLSINTEEGYIYLNAVSDIEEVQVFNTSGALVYSNNNMPEQVRIGVAGTQIYLVKVKVNGKYYIEKVFVK